MEAKVAAVKKPQIFYGWWIVVTGFLAQFMGIGVMAYATSIFYNAMFKDLKWSRGDLALAISVGAVLSGLVGLYIGARVDKYGASRLMAISAFLTGSCLMLSGAIHSLWQAYVIFTVLAIVRVGFIAIPVFAMVSNWFVKKRDWQWGLPRPAKAWGVLFWHHFQPILFLTRGGEWDG